MKRKKKLLAIILFQGAVRVRCRQHCVLVLRRLPGLRGPLALCHLRRRGRSLPSERHLRQRAHPHRHPLPRPGLQDPPERLLGRHHCHRSQENGPRGHHFSVHTQAKQNGSCKKILICKVPQVIKLLFWYVILIKFFTRFLKSTTCTKNLSEKILKKRKFSVQNQTKKSRFLVKLNPVLDLDFSKIFFITL